MTIDALNPTCDRARFWASLSLDGELSELEEAALAEHLGSCDACRSFAAVAGSATAVLREAPLEQPPTLAPPSRQRRRARPAVFVAAAVVVAVAAGAGSLVGTLSSRSGAHASAAEAAAQRPFIQQQLLALANASALPHRSGSRGRAIPS